MKIPDWIIPMRDKERIVDYRDLGDKWQVHDGALHHIAFVDKSPRGNEVAQLIVDAINQAYKISKVHGE